MIGKNPFRLAGLMTIGGLLTAAAVAAALLIPGSGKLTAPLLAGVGLVWSALLLWSARRDAAEKERQQEWVSAEVEEMASRTRSLVEYLAGEFTTQFQAILAQGRQMQGILADAIERLVGSFTGLEVQTRRQQQLADDLTGRNGHRMGSAVSDGMSIESYLQGIESMLHSFIEAATRNSDSARTLAEQMNRTSNRFDEVRGLLKEVQKIADQTNLLAINAAVEAARAGKWGQGFSVVATEVRALSVHSNNFSSQIGKAMEGITAALSGVAEAITRMGSENRELVTAAHERSASLMARTRDLNRRIGESADEISGISDQVSQEVRIAVTCLQFQDMANQILEHINGRISSLESVLTGLSGLSLDADRPAGCEQALRRYREWVDEASDLIGRIRSSPVSQKSMAEGEIELF